MTDTTKRERWRAPQERTTTPGVWKITRKDGTVMYRVMVNLGKDPATGQRRQHVSTHRTLKEARSKRSELLGDRDRGDLVLPDRRLTVRVAADQWLAGRRNVSDKAMTSYRNALDTACAALGALPVGEVDVAAVERLVAAMESGELRRRGEQGKPLGPRSIQHVVGTLGRVIDHLVKQRRLRWNPVPLVELPALPPRPDRAWSADEARAFLRSVEGDRLAVCWRLSMLGLRRSEVLGLTWAAVSDRDGGTLTIVKSKTRSGVRTVPLAGTGVAERLRAHRALLGRERLAAGEAYHGSDRLAVDLLGRPMDKDSYSRRFHVLAAEAGLRRIRLHDCRHTAGTLLRDAGVHPAVIARWLGHSKGAFSITTYADDPVTEQLTAAGEALGRAFGSG